jgi:hypothetical protein
MRCGIQIVPALLRFVPSFVPVQTGFSSYGSWLPAIGKHLEQVLREAKRVARDNGMTTNAQARKALKKLKGGRS